MCGFHVDFRIQLKNDKEKTDLEIVRIVNMYVKYFKDENLLCSSSSFSRFIKNNECILSISRSQSIATFTHLGWGTLNATKERACQHGTTWTKSSSAKNRPFSRTKHVTRCTRVMRYAKHKMKKGARLERFFSGFCHFVLVYFSKQPALRAKVLDKTAKLILSLRVWARTQLRN